MPAKLASAVISQLDPKITENCNCYRDWLIFNIKSLNTATSWNPHKGVIPKGRDKLSGGSHQKWRKITHLDDA